jgi:eukaryotic-like serine/threonine-protein kinase
MSSDEARLTQYESLLAEQRAAWRSGNPVRVSELLHKDPSLPHHPEFLQDLIYNEIILRREVGDSPTEAEYCELAPELESKIKLLFQMDRGLAFVFDLTEEHSVGNLIDDGKAVAAEYPIASIPLADATTETAPLEEHVLQVAVGRGESVDAVGLLRRRLLVVACILACNYGLAFFQMQILFFASDTQVHIQWALSGILALAACALWFVKSLSLSRLRWIELAIFAMTLAQLTTFLIERLWVHGDLAIGLEPNAFFRGHLFNTVILCYFPVIVGYGIMIPNTGARCFWVTLAMGMVPIALLLGGIPFYWIDIAMHLQTFMHGLAWVVAWIAIGVILASFGSNRIYKLQQQVSATKRYGPYRLGRKLGGGGMGDVYLAEHSLLKQPCAVKVIRRDRLLDPKTLARFEREVRATARLKHPNCVEIYDYGQNEEGTFYYVMEYLPGLTLDQIVKKTGRLPVARVIHLLRQVCGPLQEAHGIGLIHRDVKPSNIIACYRGGVADLCKLLDFGMVKDLQREQTESELTLQGGVAGTPAFMSPEQAGGREPLDGRSDLYSLGAVAYYLLTAILPFQGTAVEVMAAHLYSQIIPIGNLAPEVPEEIASLIHLCLEKVPSRRCQSAMELARRLDELAVRYPWQSQQAIECWEANLATNT